MFGLSKHIIDEAVVIASEMVETGEQIIAIRNTGLFVAMNVEENYIELHEFAIEDTPYFIVQRASRNSHVL